MSQDPSRLLDMLERSQRKSVPQVFIGGLQIGTSDDLMTIARNGRLDEILVSQALAV